MNSLCRLLLIIPIVLTACIHNDSDDSAVAGLDQRPDNLTCIAPDISASRPTDIAVEPAFPNLPYLGPVVALIQTPGDDANWYAVMQNGVVKRFIDDPNTDQALDFINIESQVLSGGELGLLGMAFHPDYANNGKVYVSYNADNPRRSIISQFINVSNQWQEEQILVVNQPYSNHNGGQIAFGPDGYLYIGFGDGGSGGDPDGNGQNTQTLLGSMLRIDVDSGTAYGIPQDNPFFGNPLCDDPNTSTAQDCPEIFAWGFRNPWRWSFDRVNGTLYAGDVGQNSIEEISVVQAGNNYGWNIMEGNECYNASSCDSSGLIMPVAVYPHSNDNRSIVGGYVYRGTDPQLSIILADTYLYGDTYTGRIWGLTQDGAVYQSQQLLNTDLQFLYSFAEANDGRLYLLDPASNTAATGSNIYKIVPGDAPPAGDSQPAQLLSQTGCVDEQNPTQPAEGLIPYEVISPLWSDNADKQRFMALPDGETVNLDEQGDFIFPAGTVLMKHFLLNGRLVETRLLMHHADRWAGYSYEWQYDNNGNPTDAQLLSGSFSKTIEGQNWYFPGPGECLQCHTSSAGIALGPETKQLNTNYYYAATGRTANQLQTLEAIGVFSSNLTPQLKSTKLYALDDSRADLQTRAKSYLHSNCAHCHQPNEVNTTDMDLRFHIPLQDMNICDAPPLRDDFGLTNPKLIDPNGTYVEPNSILLLRVQADADDGRRMPPMATEIVDTSAVEILKQWIAELDQCS
jgi:uncharacterized repeat protein (TIGR03806 family)